MIDVGALRALRSVAALGTLARAADELGFTASAVSQQIKRLERQIGTPVLAPAGRGVVLTPAGQAIVDSAPEVFQALERCAEAAQSVSEGAPRGILRVTAFSTAIRGLLAPAILRLSRCCPGLCVHITEQDPDQALHSVDAGTADLALVHDADGLPAPLPSSLTQRHLHTDVGDVVMNRAHPLTRLDPPLADLAGHAWVTSPPGSVCHQWFRRLFADVPEDPDVRHPAVAGRLGRRDRPDPSPCPAALGRRARLPAAAAATEARGTRGVAAQRQCQPSDPGGARGPRAGS